MELSPCVWLVGGLLKELLFLDGVSNLQLPDNIELKAQFFRGRLRTFVRPSSSFHEVGQLAENRGGANPGFALCLGLLPAAMLRQPGFFPLPV